MSSIRSNVVAGLAQNNLERARTSLLTAFERLSSGLRVNSAKDDAAGLAIANRFTSNIRGLTQANRNANDGVSISRTAQGALDEINVRLQRIRELTVQGLSGTYEGDAGDTIQSEINLNLKEIDRINEWAKFNGISLLDGTAGTRTLQVGARDKDTLDIDLGPPGFSVNELGLLDFTFQGTPGRVTPVSTLTGSSSRINLDDSVHTTVTHLPPEDDPNLVRPSRPGSRDVIQINGNGGRLFDVNISATHDTSTLDNAVSLTRRNAIVGPTARESISGWTFLDESGLPLAVSQPAVVSAGGAYWIRHQVGGHAVYFEAELTIHGDQHRITAQAKSSVSVAHGDMPGKVSDPLRSAPAVNKATADYTLTLDGQDESSTANLELVHLGGHYYVEEELTPGQYAYYQADVEIKTGGDSDSITVVSDRSRAISVSDQGFVSGTTIARLEPDNSKFHVKYTDLSGLVHLNVMSADAERGGYQFHLDAYVNGEGAYKTAKVVRNDDGRYLLQTVNGVGEVILYYPLYYQDANGNYHNSFSVHTNVESGVTTIELREADIAQRLRNPPDPLAALDRAMARVDTKRSELGALDNRLESVIRTNTVTSQNLSAARSRIEDADYAVEISNMTRAQILQQAGTSALSHANQVPSTVLSLLR